MSSSLGDKQKWTATNVRNTFLDYFKSKDHKFVASSPVVPFDDPTLLFTNAGMNQYKPIFQGTVDPSSDFYTLKRAYNSQKCIRAGGKHNDLEDVGKDSYHHTFFEMLGNWSFGDYFKAEAVDFSWTLLTEVYGIPKDRLYVTYFEGDAKQGLEPDIEALELWKNAGVPEDHILPGNAKDNFWEMGDQGPCGPCSEIHYDRIGGRNAASLVNQDDPDVLEVWNLVFMQYNREADGSLKSLPSKHIDTGMGFERLVSVLQDVRSNYDTDVFQPLFTRIQEITQVRPYQGKFGEEDTDNIDTAYRVLADHVRTLTFALSDGGVPNNEGRGYVLRRILRRGARYARKYMNYPIGNFFSTLAPTLIDQVKDIFPEVAKDPSFLFEILDEEEASFAKTLDRGERLFEKYAKTASETESKTLDGKQVWRLYDTYGFPVDLTELMAEEQGLKIDTVGFEKAKQESYEASKRGGKKGNDDLIKLNVHELNELNQNNVAKTDDHFKYGFDDVESKILKLHDGEKFVDKITESGKKYGVLLDKTCFYAEQGGQEYDTGKIVIDDVAEFNVDNVQLYNGFVFHTGTLEEGKLSVGDSIIASYDELRRFPIKNNHTGTHILNFALEAVLGNGVDQKGSLVAPEKLRFDFSHKKALTMDELRNVEEICNKQIKDNLPVYYQDVPLELAKSISSVRAVFGETYPDPVRVVSIGKPVDDLLKDPSSAEWKNFSVEFCGGTHVAKTSDIKYYIILEENGIAKGIRRIVAVTGSEAFEAQRIADEFDAELIAAEKLPFSPLKEKKLKELGVRLGQLSISVISKHELKEKFTKIEKVVKDEVKTRAKAETKQTLDEVKTYFTENPDAKYFVKFIDIPTNAKAITEAVNYMKTSAKDKSMYLFTGNDPEGRLSHGCYISDDALSTGIEGPALAKEVSNIIGGKAGGKGNVFQGMGDKPSEVNKAVEEVTKLLSEKL
ncbi:similar to Saccharomyces cerevisiae YOR335C ALA1 Cytoplasmic and mitochondrial alanyl-tRNA synthetase, required for protein synthesis [Maudiozyma barnettii]|uniref:Alanine--tRNA ligase n=1 Tax=Maudiozyma barnettii TaxID=61262 RepID=A0A8H2VG71_9SACH|nr:alanine--tRNA ligase [Kazachstania barnettii]CAB4254860.1 similar to Saccharomyces cerevisiae YOR335C ALA1 Cytoplasmic and mitochondrial alanyl-tRNA synthetase, required for protein synthesis [Kazachstania barnettii]CAD1783081.1 similar to Saccharomyces cerevisiae YOR335C ALA1 Cytoplasmic and mitochondrial alanyl-tRNA synthetase, required for protein synthesis [Kazachstania barnettii]